MAGPGGAFPALFRGGKAAAIALAVLCAVPPASALGPHEVALVVNADSTESIFLASVYARLRAIPESNVVRVSVPKGEDGAVPEAMTRAAFRTRVWEPVNEELAKRGLSQQVLAWVYSCGFPVRVTEKKSGLSKGGVRDLSIAGATFVRAKWPVDEEIERGSFESPLYLGPGRDGGDPDPPEAFDQLRNRLLEDMPLPAAMLAWTGERGIKLSEAAAALERSAAADSTSPAGTFWFAVNDDVRSTCRSWQYEAAAAALRARPGAKAEISGDQPGASAGPVVGYMTGSRGVKAPKTLAPGAFADHLTSWACAFSEPAQTKAVKWLSGGASFTCGTVAEPYALWEKFPTAWIFDRQLAGLTAVEAFYETCLCPLQQLPLGDPLSKPWAPVVEPSISGPDGSRVSGRLELEGTLADERDAARARYTWLVDGRPAGSSRTLILDTATLPDGPHVVRLVARVAKDGVRHQGFAEVAYVFSNRKRRAK